MLTKAQKRTLAELVRRNQSVLFSKFGGGVTRKKKEAIWEDIRHRLISMGADLPDVRNVRDFEWGNLKRAAAKRCAENRMTELDQMVMDTLAGIKANAAEEAEEPENIEVTPTIYHGFNGHDPDATSESNASSKMAVSSFLANQSGISTNGHDPYQESPIPLEMPPGDMFDSEVIHLTRQKVRLENDFLRQQMNELRERSKRDKKKFRLESEKLQLEIDTQKARKEAVRLNIINLELQAQEIKARTEYFEAVKMMALSGNAGSDQDVRPVMILPQVDPGMAISAKHDE